MSIKQQHKPGYKHTPLGWIPEEWKIKSLSDDIENLDAGVSVNSINESPTNGEPAILKTSAVNGGFFYPEQKKRIIAEDISRAKLNPTDNSIIVSRMNTPELVGECGYVGKTFENIFLPDRLWQTRFYSNSEVNVKWLNYLLNAPRYKTKIKNIATGTSNSMKNISKEAFLNIAYISPPKNEQCKIATILSTWDEAITKTQQLIAQLQQRNKGLMQQLLAGRKRFKGFEAEWKKARLGDYLIKHEEKTSVSNQYPVLTSSREGLFLQRDYYKREVASIDNTGYNVVPRGFFTYRHMSDDLVFKFNINDIVDRGIVSTLYPVFTTTEGLDKHFLKYKLNEGREFAHFALEQKQGGSRTYVYFSKLSELKIMLPSLDEQTAIRVAIETAHSEQLLFEQKLAALQQQKKGLMQKLLTGEVRVKL